MDDRELEHLRRENDLLRAEVRVSREAADITARAVIDQFEKTEQMLQRFERANAERVAVLDAATTVSIIAAGLDGRIHVFNRGAEHLLGYSATEVVGRLHPQVFHLQEELAARAEVLSKSTGAPVQPDDVLATLAQSRRTEPMRWTYVKKDGTAFPVEMSVTLLQGGDGAVSGFLCAGTDLTERERVQSEIRTAMEATEEANRTKSAFLANMSHELRTPLNAIIGYSEMLIEECEDDGHDGFLPDLKNIRTAGKHLLGLINSVLDLSKIEAGKVELSLEPFPVRELLTELTTLSKPLVDKNHNRLVVHCDENVGEMVSDMLRLRQILFNLLSNACKFTENGTVTLAVTRVVAAGHDFIEFHIADTGIGMTPEQAARLFTPFVQADASTTKKFGGTGLGLSISKKLCELMSGAIWFESDAGRGSVFHVRLPADPEGKRVARDVPESSATHALAAHVSGIAPAQGTVLVIDDDPTVRDLMGRVLSRQGYRVLEAWGGDEGLRQARAHHPDVIMLDIMMPDRDGWSVLNELKSHAETADIPVLLATMVDEKEKGLALGAAEYLIKPLEREPFLALIDKHRPKCEREPVVLVVDDDPQIREMMTRTLTKAGWQTMEAENGEVALAQMRSVRPDFIVLDLMMPVMGGFEFLAHARANPAWREIPVVVATALDLNAQERACLTGRVDAVLEKNAGDRAGLYAAVVSQVETALKQKP